MRNSNQIGKNSSNLQGKRKVVINHRQEEDRTSFEDNLCFNSEAGAFPLAVMCLRCGASAGVTAVSPPGIRGCQGDSSKFMVQATADVKLSNITTMKCLKANQYTKFLPPFTH